MPLTFQLTHPAYASRKAALRARVRAACAAALGRRADARLSVLLADDAALQQMNHDFRGKDAPTNVLAFPSGEENYLGDIAISLDRVAAEAEAQGKEFLAHLSHLAVHGVLHLLGYDHEEDAEAETMEAREVSVLHSLSLPNPYA